MPLQFVILCTLQTRAGDARWRCALEMHAADARWRRLKLLHAGTDVVLYSVVFLGGLGAVPLIHGAYQIAGDSADPLKRNVLELIIEIGKISVDLDVQMFQLSVIFPFQIFYISLALRGRCVSCDLYAHDISPPFLRLNLLYTRILWI